MIQEVERLKTELEQHLLVDRKSLHQRGIEVRSSRPEQRIAPGISVGVLRWSAVGRCAEPVVQAHADAGKLLDDLSGGA